jgi:hypothetical protein
VRVLGDAAERGRIAVEVVAAPGRTLSGAWIGALGGPVGVNRERLSIR